MSIISAASTVGLSSAQPLLIVNLVQARVLLQSCIKPFIVILV